MRESEYDRARREIRRLDAALTDKACVPTLSSFEWRSILRKRSRCAHAAWQAVQKLPFLNGALWKSGMPANVAVSVLAMIDAFEALGLHWDEEPGELE